jgi:hypothetical protein
VVTDVVPAIVKFFATLDILVKVKWYFIIN